MKTLGDLEYVLKHLSEDVVMGVSYEQGVFSCSIGVFGSDDTPAVLARREHLDEAISDAVEEFSKKKPT